MRVEGYRSDRHRVQHLLDGMPDLSRNTGLVQAPQVM
jgi:hypothetical protein